MFSFCLQSKVGEIYRYQDVMDCLAGKIHHKLENSLFQLDKAI